MSVALFTGLLIFYVYSNGMFYALDDAYIHLQLAKTFAHIGLPGIVEGEFASASSSPLWTLILSIFTPFSFVEVVPLLMNYIFGLLLLIKIFNILRFYLIDLNAFIVITLLISLLLPTMAMTGMEHLAHVYFTLLLFIHYFVEKKGINFKFCIMALLATGLRYESAFLLIAISSIDYYYNRNYKSVVKLLLFGASIPIIMGLYSVSNGALFLPNSVVVKSLVHNPDNSSLYNVALKIKTNIFSGLSYLIPFFFLFFSLIISFKKLNIDLKKIIVFLFLVFTFHNLLAKNGHYFRYESYLVLIGGLICTLYCNQLKITKISKFALLLFLVFISWRGIKVTYQTNTAIHNIKNQQVLITNKLNEIKELKVLACNDIGYLSYKGTFNVVDILGLGNTQIAKAKKDGVFNKSYLSQFCFSQNVDIIAIYPQWFDDGKLIPEEFELFAKLVYTGKEVVLGGKVVNFYCKAIDKPKFLPYFEHWQNPENTIELIL